MSKFKIPTILGLSIIFLGIIAGVFLNLKDQIFLSKASSDLTPQNILVTNITDYSVSISWQTNSAAISFVTFGQSNVSEQTVLTDQDTASGVKPAPRLIHYATLKNLIPKTNYQFKIISGKTSSEIGKFQTAGPLTTQTGFTPVIGSVLDGDAPLNEGTAFLSVSGATTQSAPVKTGGNFLIPLSSIRKTDLSDIYPLSEDTIGKITIASERGTANLLFKLKASSLPLPSIKLGQNIDLTNLAVPPTPEPVIESNYDLNDDGKLNAADNAIILQNFGAKPKDKKADLNNDGVVDQKDLNLMSQKLKESGSQ